MSLKEKFSEFENLFIETWGEYTKLQDELNLYRGKELNETSVKEVNKLVRAIQEKFHELYPVFIFVKERYKFSSNAVFEYNKFIDDIKQAGAIEEQDGRA